MKNPVLLVAACMLTIASFFVAPAAEARFLQVDPIGYEDQMNLYAYVRNDPVNLTDPSGRCTTCWVELRATGNVPKVVPMGPAFAPSRQIAREELARFGRAHNNAGDAMRHARWNFRMIDEAGMDPTIVKMIGIQHEIEGLLSGQPMEEFWMDLNNNAEGRTAAEEGRTIDPSNLVTSANQGDNNYEKYDQNQQNSSNQSSGGTQQTEVKGSVRVSGRIESQRISDYSQCVKDSEGAGGC